MVKKRSKATLFLFELIIIILIFSICCAICVSLFFYARQRSISAKDLTASILCAETIAEALKSEPDAFTALEDVLGAEKKDADYVLYYDGNWKNIASAAAAKYEAYITLDNTKTFFSAMITITKGGEKLFEIPIAHAGV